MNDKKIKIMYILVHALFWCGYAIAWSYTAVYLKSCGYENSIVGLVTGIGAVISVVIQPILATITAKSKILNNSRNIILFKTFSLVCVVLIMIKLPGIYTIAVLFTVIAAIDASIPSILSSIAMDYVNSGKNVDYGLARGVGSITYAAFSFILGYVVEIFGPESLMFLYLIIGVVNIFVVLMLPYETVKITKDENTSNNVIKEYSFLIYFLISAVLLFMGHNMVNVFLINIIENAGGDSSNLGVALAIGAGVELPVMAGFVWLANKFKIEKLLIFSSVFFTLKSFATIFAGSMAMVYIVSFMQFGAFALFTPASVYFINKAMKPEHRGVGQALLGSCSLGLGGTLGNVVGGFILDSFSLNVMLVSATVLAATGVVFMITAGNMYSKIEGANLLK